MKKRNKIALDLFSKKFSRVEISKRDISSKLENHEFA